MYHFTQPAFGEIEDFQLELEQNEDPWKKRVKNAIFQRFVLGWHCNHAEIWYTNAPLDLIEEALGYHFQCKIKVDQWGQHFLTAGRWQSVSNEWDTFPHKVYKIITFRNF